MRFNRFTLLILGILCTYLVGCDKDDNNPVVVESSKSSLPTYEPKGTITGLIKDACTNQAIKGAVLSLSYSGSVRSVKSDDAGQFSFDNVPAGQFKVINGSTVATGTYTVTASLVDYNKSVTDTTKRYRDYYYSTVTITFTSLVPGDSLGVSGLVGSVIFNISQLNTTIVGQVVDKDMKPVANARVFLYDQSITPGVILKQALTDEKGRYKFSGVDNGITVNILAQSSDAKYEGSIPAPFNIPCNLIYDSLRAFVNAERIQLRWANNVAPYVINISPQNNADVSPTNLIITYTFSAPIKQTPYTRTDLGKGHGTIVDDIVVSYNGMKKTDGVVSAQLAWNSTMTELTIQPAGLVGSARYSVDVRTALPKLQDEAGLAVVNNASIVGDFEVLNFTTTGASPIPAAPVLKRIIAPTLNFGNLDFSGGVVRLEWNAVEHARSYNLYRQIGDGPFERIHENVFSLYDTNNTGPLVFPKTTQPLWAHTVKYQVRAVSKDLVEGPASNTITISDNVQPALITVQATAFGTQRYQLRMQFSEPLKLEPSENIANYLIENTDTVQFTKENAVYLGHNAGIYEVALTVSITNGNTLPDGLSIRVSSSVVDLAGNAMDDTLNTYEFSPPPAPRLQSPANNATGIASNAILTWRSANGAKSYRVQISKDVGFITIIYDKENISSTSLSLSSVSGLVSGTTYYWRVQASNSAGSSAYSTIWSFTLQ
ncbi:MAG: carboxypeptidase regulatory-like domain-containing protein [Bacteroidetes bacterium]|nr:carboxypeptidase regulatory-like domain-containing protein [Bacteroidota bacterium]